MGGRGGVEEERKSVEWTAGESGGEEGEGGEGEGGGEDGSPPSPRPPLSPGLRWVDRPSLPISTFYLLPFLTALSLHHADVSPLSPSHWSPLPSDLSSLTALQLTSAIGRSPEAAAAIRACLPRLCFVSVQWAESSWRWKGGEDVQFEDGGGGGVGEGRVEGAEGGHVVAEEWMRGKRRMLRPYSRYVEQRDDLRQLWKQSREWDTLDPHH